MMPKIDGFEVLKTIRNDSNIVKQPIVIMATALKDGKTIKKEERLGANAFMTKPINYKVVTIMLDKYLPMVPQEIDEEEVEYFGDFDDMFDDLEDSIAEESNLSPNAIMLNNIVNKNMTN